MGGIRSGFGFFGQCSRRRRLEHPGQLQRRDALLGLFRSGRAATYSITKSQKEVQTMAGKSSGDRRKPLRTLKGGKNAAPAKSIRVGVIDYKDVATLRKFISERGKIRARRITGVSVQEQRLIARAVKNAREMALLPYAGSGR